MLHRLMDQNHKQVKKNEANKMSTLLKGSGVNFIGAFFRNSLGFIFVWMMAKFLSPEETGLYFLGLSIATFFSIISLAGMENGVRRYVSIYNMKDDIGMMQAFVATALWIAIPLVMVLSGSLFVFSNFIATTIFLKPELTAILKLLSIYLPFFVLASLLLAVTQGLKYMQFKVFCFDIINFFIRIVAALILFIMGYRVLGAIISQVVAIFWVSGLSVYFFLKVFPWRKKKYTQKVLQFKELLSFSLPQTFTSILQKLINMNSTLMLGYFATSSSVGIFNISEKIILVGNAVLLSFNTMLGPMIAGLYANNNRNDLEEIYKKVTKWCISLIFPFSFLLLFFPDNVMAFFGKEYVQGANCLRVLSIGLIVNASTGPAGLILLMTGRVFLVLFNTMLTLISSAVLCYVLVPHYDVIGAAAASSVSMILVNLIRVFLIYKLEKMHPYQLNTLKPIFSCAVSFVILAWPVSQLLGNSNNHLLFFTGSFFFLVCYISIMAFLGLDETDKYLLKRVKNKLSGIFVVKRD